MNEAQEAREFPPTTTPDPDCICKGNWRNIVKKSEPLLNGRFKEISSGREYIFFGVVHAKDDYYYGMCDEDRSVWLLSCVGDLDQHGFKQIK
jgi:hypothetical protein